MKKEEKGTIVIISVIATALLLALGIYFLRSVTTEMKISKSIESAKSAYYIAESGVHEALWKLENDPEWRDNFVSEELNPNPEGDFWTDSFTRESFGGGSYQVTISNISRGRGEIVSVASVPFMDRKAVRKIKTSVFRGLEDPTENAAMFSGGLGANIHLINSHLIINDGNLFCNHNIIISSQSILELYDNPETEKLEGQILSTQNFLLSPGSELVNYTLICTRDICEDGCQNCPPEEILIPIVDFDSDDPNSFYSRAMRKDNCLILCKEEGGDPYPCSQECVFSSSEFGDLLFEVGEGGSLIVENEITYVRGGVDVRGGRSLIINGVLLSDGNIKIGERYKWGNEEGISHLEINRPGGESPSGILSKRGVYFGEYAFLEDSHIEGVVYAGDKIEVIGINKDIHIIGGIIARKIDLAGKEGVVEITLDNENILYGLGHMVEGNPVVPYFSPVIRVDHWEEIY